MPFSKSQTSTSKNPWTCVVQKLLWFRQKQLLYISTCVSTSLLTANVFFVMSEHKSRRTRVRLKPTKRFCRGMNSSHKCIHSTWGKSKKLLLPFSISPNRFLRTRGNSIRLYKNLTHLGPFRPLSVLLGTSRAMQVKAQAWKIILEPSPNQLLAALLELELKLLLVRAEPEQDEARLSSIAAPVIVFGEHYATITQTNKSHLPSHWSFSTIDKWELAISNTSYIIVIPITTPKQNGMLH